MLPPSGCLQRPPTAGPWTALHHSSTTIGSRAPSCRYLMRSDNAHAKASNSNKWSLGCCRLRNGCSASALARPSSCRWCRSCVGHSAYFGAMSASHKAPLHQIRSCKATCRQRKFGPDARRYFFDTVMAKGRLGTCHAGRLGARPAVRRPRTLNPRTGPSPISCRRAPGWWTAASPDTRSAPRCGARTSLPVPVARSTCGPLLSIATNPRDIHR